nr:sugar dehydrogenase complex small subunit [Mycetohabitans sp. B2]
MQKTLACVAAGLVGSPLLRAAAQGNDALLDAFMTVSRALTGKATLPRDVGGRLAEALQKKTPDLAQRVQQLAGALASGKLNDAQTALALRILQAWYVGEVDGMVVIYEQALMFAVVSDMLVIRTYCPNKPGFWASKPIERQS